jgi:hypothetical protein
MEARRDMLKLRFFGRLVRMDKDRVVRKVFLQRKGGWQEGDEGWMGHVKKVMGKYELGEWWNEGKWKKFPKKKEWERMVDERVGKEEARRWRQEMEGKVTLENYRRVQNQLVMADYLLVAKGYRPGTVLRTKLRGGTNALRVSQGRHQKPKLERHERICLVCNSGHVEDEAHFVMTCTALEKPRARMWDSITSVVSEQPEVARTIRMMTDNELFEFVLGKRQSFKEPRGVTTTIEAGLAAMYEARKGCLYDQVFKPKKRGGRRW